MLKGLFHWHTWKLRISTPLRKDEDSELSEEEMAEVMGKSSSLYVDDDPGKGTTFDSQLDCPCPRWWVVVSVYKERVVRSCVQGSKRWVVGEAG